MIAGHVIVGHVKSDHSTANVRGKVTAEQYMSDKQTDEHTDYMTDGHRD